jgi:hypothetical protein
MTKSVTVMKSVQSSAQTLTTYQPFVNTISDHIKILEDFVKRSTTVSFSIQQCGIMRALFYELYSNESLKKTILYTMQFHGFIQNISKLNKKLQPCAFGTKTSMTKSYYPTKHPVKNSYTLSNMIITGPNASGKTTILKSTLINIIFTQQFGCGFYDSAQLLPFKYIHCYLNIPDTSGRDSLFQAEARRCKEIIDCIEEKEKDNEKHFAIFDELYSGTNPDEAVISAKAFMDFIVKNDNVTCLLTTHYVKLCKKLSKNKKIENFNMKTIKKNNNFSYTYELEKGISNVKGGLKVLSDMDYPKEILEQTSEHFLQKN